GPTASCPSSGLPLKRRARAADSRCGALAARSRPGARRATEGADDEAADGTVATSEGVDDPAGAAADGPAAPRRLGPRAGFRGRGEPPAGRARLGRVAAAPCRRDVA